LLCSQHPWRYIIGCCLIGSIVVIVVAIADSVAADAVADADDYCGR
jgi:hypothetical protein